MPIVNIHISPIFDEALLQLGLRNSLALVNPVEHSDWLNSSDSLANWGTKASRNGS